MKILFILTALILCSCQKELNFPPAEKTVDIIHLTYKFDMDNGLYITAMLDKPAKVDTKVLIQYNTGDYLLGVWIEIPQGALQQRTIALYLNTVHYDSKIKSVSPSSGDNWAIKY